MELTNIQLTDLGWFVEEPDEDGGKHEKLEVVWEVPRLADT